MSELRADTITSATDNTDLEIQARGTGVPNLESGFKVNGTVGVPVSALQTGTDGELITWDASGNPATVATGTAGQVLTSAGAGAAPSFGDIVGGSLTLIGTQTASASASLTQTGLDGTYDSYVIRLTNIIPATDAVFAWLRLGDSGGIDSGASDYQWHSETNYAGGSPAAASSTSDSEIQLTHTDTTNVGNATGETFSATIWINRTTSKYVVVGGNAYYNSKNVAAASRAEFVGNRQAAITLDRVQFLFSTGNITSGRMTTWGVSYA